MTEEQFDQLLKEMREDDAPAEQVAAARDRVWHRIAGSTSLACAEFRPEFGAYLAGQLTESRRLLLDDHLGRCGECRLCWPRPKARAKSSDASNPPFAALWLDSLGHRRRCGPRRALSGANRLDSALAPSGSRATVMSVTGALYRLPQSALQAGSTLSGQ